MVKKKSMKSGENASPQERTTIGTAMPIESSLMLNREVLFVIPAQLTRPYFLELCRHCEESIFVNNDDRFRIRPILRCVPARGPVESGHAIRTILDRDLKSVSPGQIAAIVVAPTGDQTLERDVASFSKEHAIPAVALSLPFQHPKVFTEYGIAVPPHVISNGTSAVRELGRHAAETLSKSTHTDTIVRSNNPTVLLFPGEENRTDSKERIENFKAGMTNAGVNIGDPSFRIMQSCHWQRRTARKTLIEFMNNRANPRPDVIYCANDSMALGCIDYLEHSFSDRIPVYGFDATEEARVLISSNDNRFFYGTVQQNMSEMATQLRQLLADMLISETPHLKDFRSREVNADTVFCSEGCRVFRAPREECPVPEYEELSGGLEIWIEEQRVDERWEALKRQYEEKYFGQNIKWQIKVSGLTLQQHRTGSRFSKNPHYKKDKDERWGRDGDGRMWRKLDDGRIVWLIDTLFVKR